MKELVSHWISNLAVIAILAALVDMVLPDGNFRKYTGFIFGLLILILILQPLLLLVREIPNLDIRVIKNTANHQKQVLSIHELQGKVNKEKELERLLREKLEKKLALELEQRKGIISPKITIMFSKKNGKIDFSNIYKIDINCYVKDEKTLINPIVIDTRNNSYNKHPNSNKTLSEDEVMEIKQLVSNLYEIDTDIVTVNGR